MIRIMEEERREKNVRGKKAPKLGHFLIRINPGAHFLGRYNELLCRKDQI